MVKIQIAGGAFALVDKEDAWVAERFSWHRMGSQKYAATWINPRRPGQRVLYLHDLVMGRAPEGKLVDHRDGNVLDCRKSNLRWATPQQNMQNQKRHKDNRSGFKGVYLMRRNGQPVKLKKPWKAAIKSRLIGYFATPEEAHRAYVEAATKAFGEFARAT